MKIFTERLNQIYRQSGARSIKQFAEAAGLVCGTLTDTLHNGTEPRYNILKSILRANPDVSAEWLMRGEGSMYRSQCQQRVARDVSVSNTGGGNASVNGDIATKSEFCRIFVKTLQEQIKRKDECISCLAELLQSKEEDIKKLIHYL